jgi:hypothetical protein
MKQKLEIITMNRRCDKYMAKERSNKFECRKRGGAKAIGIIFERRHNETFLNQRCR